MPPWGRPSGAKGTRKRRQWEWEQQQARVEELDSDDTDTQGVGLDFGNEKRFASDSLHFTGTDLASTRARRSYVVNESGGSSEDSEMSETEGIDALQIALRDKEEALVQSALKRIRRAQEKGKKEVNLKQEELDALENRRKRMQAAATAKARKDSASSGGSGSEKKRRSARNITIPLAPPEPESRSQSSSRPSSRRSKGSNGRSRNNEALGPAFMLAGADGLVYAPVPASSSKQPSPNRNSTSRPRASTNSQPTRGAPAPYFAYPLQPGNPRHYSDGRPASSASNKSRPMPDDENWIPNSRRSSGSAPYIVDPFEYQVSSDTPPPIPPQYMHQHQHQPHPQPGRRAVSGPQEVAYSSVRRSLPAGSYRVPIDPNLYRRRSDRDELAEEYYSSSEEDSDDGNGVQVYVDDREEQRKEEKEKERAVTRKPVGGGSGRKKSKR